MACEIIEFVCGENPGDAEQALVMRYAFKKYQERNAKYRDLWKKNGWEDSLFHLRHKVSRIAQMAGEEDSIDEVEDSVIDAINYLVFFLRNHRVGHRGS